MTMASAHRYGLLAAALLWGVAVLALMVDVRVGIILSIPLIVASMGMVDAVRVYLTRTWPKVEADALGQHEDPGSTTSIKGGSAVTRYVQRLSYDYQGQRRDASLTWLTHPPSQVVVRVNPDHPAEVFCLEHLGDTWVFFFLTAALLPLVVGITVWLGLGRLPRFLAGLVVLGAIALWGRRLRPVDRAETLASRSIPST